MASSSGNSSGSNSTPPIPNLGSEGDRELLMDQRKRKRMQSNRESARRSRMRKQKHLDDLMAQVEQLRNENSRILSSTSITTQQYLDVEAENSVLRAQMMELTQRLDSLNEILGFMSGCNNEMFVDGIGGVELLPNSEIFTNNPWNLIYPNQPIIASANMFPY